MILRDFFEEFNTAFAVVTVFEQVEDDLEDRRSSGIENIGYLLVKPEGDAGIGHGGDGGIGESGGAEGEDFGTSGKFVQNPPLRPIKGLHQGKIQNAAVDGDIAIPVPDKIGAATQ